MTYRYFLKDRDTQEHDRPVQARRILVSFLGTATNPAWATNGPHAAGPRQERRRPHPVVHARRLGAGRATAGGRAHPRPADAAGPGIGIADVGFADGMLVLTIALGADRASLDFGGTAGATAGTSQAQDRAPGHGRPDRRAGHLRPRRRRVRPAQRQRRASTRPASAGCASPRSRPRSRTSRPDRRRRQCSATTRPRRPTRTAGAAADRQRDDRLPELGVTGSAAALRPDRRPQRRRAADGSRCPPGSCRAW